MAGHSLIAPRTLFSRLLGTIALVSVLFQLFTLWVIGYLLLVPVGQRSADDLAALMVIAAESSVAQVAQSGYAVVESSNGLRVRAPDTALPYSSSLLPYVYFVENSLKERMGHPVPLRVSSEQGDEWFWADIPLTEGMVRVGFSRSRIGVHPPFALFLVLSVGGLVILATAVLLAHRLSRPLERLARAARHLGSGRWPEPVPEQGPEELALLARSFNLMIQQVQELLANRTTLLAGISHDLRTPLSRIQLALAMLPQEAEAELIEGIQRDIDEMNRLIGQFLEIGRDLGAGSKDMVDIRSSLRELAEDACRGGAVVTWHEGGPCSRELQRLAMCRIVSNLLENAMRYGAGEPVELAYTCGTDLVIRIMDRGPGIPAEAREAVFRPFYRLEHSRSSNTGGSGLGLAIARQLALANGWRIELLPREGGGTIAQITLPAD